VFQLNTETNGEWWTIVGNSEPELLHGSGSGTLLPTGEIFFCHDTKDPIMFDPVSGLKWCPPGSLSAQGCHTTTLNTDGGKLTRPTQLTPPQLFRKKERTVFQPRDNKWQMEDTEIIAAVQSGESDAFSALVERYQRKLYYFVVGKVADDTEAKDIVQKSFVVAFQNLSAFRSNESFFAWLKGIALNHCRNEWRRYQSQARLAGRLIEEKRAELELASFESRVEENEPRLSALRQCLEELSSHEQSVVDMRFVQELPLAAIGEQLGRGTEAARVLLYRIRQRLADCVKKRLSLEIL
jgi:RNA polymerase sigma-70 factor, ECF subfamily